MRVIERKISVVLAGNLPTVLIQLIAKYLLEHDHSAWGWQLRAVRFGQAWRISPVKYWGWKPHNCDSPCLCLVDGPWDREIRYVEPTDARPWDLCGDVGSVFAADIPIWNECSDDYMQRCGLVTTKYKKQEYKRDSFHRLILVTYSVRNRLVYIQFSEPIVPQPIKLLNFLNIY